MSFFFQTRQATPRSGAIYYAVGLMGDGEL